MRVLTSSFIVSSLFFSLLTANLSPVGAQSGRKAPPQTQASPGQPETVFAPDPDRDEYQLIFSKISDGEKLTRKLGSWDRWEYHAASFSDDLTRVGSQGYRLTSIAFSPRLAVLRRDDHQYEYAIVHISSRRQMFPNDPQFALTYEPWARKGFRVADYIVFVDWCENTWNDGIMSPADCTYSSAVVLERRMNAKLPHAYDIVQGPTTFNTKKRERELLEELEDARKLKLYPAHMLTKSQVLRQSPLTEDDEDLAGNELEIVTGGDLKKRINALAQKGYRLIIRPVLYEAALMHRKKGITDPSSYIWLREKKIEQELPRLQEQGAIYRMNYGCATELAGGYQMIFEQPSVKDGKKREYKVLAIELKQTGQDVTEKMEVELASGSKNGTDEFKRLTIGGFVPRDFFGCYLSDKKNRPTSFKILFERIH